MSLYLGNSLISGVATPIEGARNIGQIVQSTIPLTDAGLHLLDGSLISGSGSYSDFVTYIAGLVSSYPDLFDTEANWQTAVTTYGVCGKFVYDSVNNTVRLPKYNSKFYSGGGIANAKGNGIALGLARGDSFQYKGGLTTTAANNASLNWNAGAYGTTVDQQVAYGSGPSVGSVGITNDATKSGIITDLSTITTSLDGYWYIVIATSTKTQIEVDIDEIATDLNGKADVDLSNCTKPHIVDTYENGTSWYRVYSDGWCEQGGHLTSAGSVALLKPFIDTNYNVTCGNSFTVARTDTNSLLWSKESASSIYFVSYPSYGGSGADWRACGYIN